MCGKLKPIVAGKLHKRRIPPALPGRKTDKTAPARVHDTDIALDVRPVVQSTYNILYTYNNACNCAIHAVLAGILVFDQIQFFTQIQKSWF